MQLKQRSILKLIKHILFICGTNKLHWLLVGGLLVYVNVHFVCSGSPIPSSMQNMLERGQGEAINNQIPKGRPHTLYICSYLLHWSVWIQAPCSMTTEANGFNEIRHVLNGSLSVNMSDEITTIITRFSCNKLPFKLHFTDNATKSLFMPCQFYISIQSKSVYLSVL